MMFLLKMLLVTAVAHAQGDLPYPLQLVRLAPSGVSPILYEKNRQPDAILPGSPPSENELPASSEEMSQFHSQDAAGRSLFGYMLPDQMRIEARRPDGTVRGSYVYRDASGQAFKVQYWDEGQGFHAAGSHLPGTYSQLPQPVQDTPEVEAARKQHMAAYKQVLERQLQLLYHHQQLEQLQVASQPDGEAVVVESDPAAPPLDYGEDDAGQRYPALPLLPALYDPSHVHDASRDAVIVDSAGARQSLQGSTHNARQNAEGSETKVPGLAGIHTDHQGVSGQHYVIIYEDNMRENNGIGDTEDGKPSPKHVRSVRQATNTSNTTVSQIRSLNDARRSRRGRISIYDYIAEHDPERMARSFPESYLIQQIFNSSKSESVVDDTDALQRAAEREFQFLKKIGSTKGHEQTDSALVAADVTRSGSGRNSRIFYKAGIVIPDMGYSSRSSATSEESVQRNAGARQGNGQGFIQDIAKNYNQNQGISGISGDRIQSNPGSRIINGRHYLHDFANNYSQNRGSLNQGFTYVDDNPLNNNLMKTAVDVSGNRSTQGYHIMQNGRKETSRDSYSSSRIFPASQNTNYPDYILKSVVFPINRTEAPQGAPFNVNLHRQQPPFPALSSVIGTHNYNLNNLDRQNYEVSSHAQQSDYHREELFPKTSAISYVNPNARNIPNPVYDPDKLIREVYNASTRREMYNAYANRGRSSPTTVTPLFNTRNILISNVDDGDTVQTKNTFSTQTSQTYSRPTVHNVSESSYAALFYKMNGDSDDSYRDDSKKFSDAFTEPHISGNHYSSQAAAYQNEAALHNRHPASVTNVGGFPPVAMQYLHGDSYQHSGGKETILLDNLIGRSAYSKARSLHAQADGQVPAGRKVEVERPLAATKEELLTESVAAGFSNSDRSRGFNVGDTERHPTNAVASGTMPLPQQSVISLKDGPGESYSAMFLQPGRQATGASDVGVSMPQPQKEGGFFYSFHHPVIPVAVQLAHPMMDDDTSRVASAEVRSPPRGLSVSQRASLYDAVPVAAVHDAQVPPYLRGAVSDHQTKPIFIHYDPAEGAVAN